MHRDDRHLVKLAERAHRLDDELAVLDVTEVRAEGDAVGSEDSLEHLGGCPALDGVGGVGDLHAQLPGVASLGHSGLVEAQLAGLQPGEQREVLPLRDRVLANGKVIRAVAGFDATLSAPKSLSVLWALTGGIEGAAGARSRNGNQA